LRGSDVATVNALAAARHEGLAPRSLITIWAKSLVDGSIEQFCFWDHVLPADVEVISGTTGALEQRAFASDGAVIKVNPIKLTSDLSYGPASFQLNRLHPRVQLMMTNYTVRLRPVEIHRVPLTVKGRLPVAPPRCRFLGIIETAKRTRPKVGEEGSLTFNCMSDAAQLVRTNPAKRSDETQRLRLGDRQMKYADVAHEWELSWGEADGKPT